MQKGRRQSNDNPQPRTNCHTQRSVTVTINTYPIIVATGESVAAAEKAYYNLLKDNGQTATGTVGDSAVEGKVVSLSSAVVSGNTYYYFMLEGDSNIYIASIHSSHKLPLMKIGDTVKFEYDKKSVSIENVISIEVK